MTPHYRALARLRNGQALHVLIIKYLTHRLSQVVSLIMGVLPHLVQSKNQLMGSYILTLQLPCWILEKLIL